MGATVKWGDVFMVVMATFLVAAMSVLAVRTALDEIHDHIDKVEENLDRLEWHMDQLEQDMEAFEEREALRGIKCGGFDPDDRQSEEDSGGSVQVSDGDGGRD